MGALTDRINRQKPQPQPEQRIPEWKRRAQEQVEKIGYVAVKDLTERAA